MKGVTSLLAILLVLSYDTNALDRKYDLKVFTVATNNQEDGFLRFNRSATIYGHDLEVIGVGKSWQGGEVKTSPGGGQKINLLIDALKRYKNEDDLLILFVDSYDVILSAGPDEIVNTYTKSFPGAKVVFSAEPFCWPDAKLASKYPTTEKGGKRFLNSGGYIGFAPQIYEILTHEAIKDDEDDQLYFTKLFLDEKLRNKWSIKLDSRSEIFQNLNGAAGEVELIEDDSVTYLVNSLYKTRPLIIHGNGPSKIHLNSIGNYISRGWDRTNGCTSCKETGGPKLQFDSLEDSSSVANVPTVTVAVFIQRETPFMEFFFEDLKNLEYPKSKVSIIIFNSIPFHDSHVAAFTESVGSDLYHEVVVMDRNDDELTKEWILRTQGLNECLKLKCDYYFSIDSEARITNPKTLTHLIEQNKKIISPLLVRDFKLWSNFWGALSSDGFYSRSFDYIDIVKNNRRGVWNVPHVSTVYLMKGSLIQRGLAPGHSHPEAAPSIEDEEDINDMMIDEEPNAPLGFLTFKSVSRPGLDPDMALTQSLRENGVFIFVDNMFDFGHLVNPENFSTAHVNPDLYELYNNQLDWERKYIHPNYSQIFNESMSIIEQPCPDVYWFPVVTETFCQHLIQEMENFGKWSSGTNEDERLTTGYENVPTRDIHMNQVGLESQWLHFLREYIRPVQEKIFVGYHHDPPKSVMNFVVRYRPDEQPSLRPHHDSSTYTINIALNKPGIDYKGGGCRFIRYNCSVTNLRQGWSLIHPGRLTHYHEGLRVTDGTRYIMISFVDP